MYIPQTNLCTDTKEIVAFMQQYSFATIVSSNNNFPVATHLPFLIEKHDEKIYLLSHFAKGNIQWQGIEDKIVLVIFNEPHAYISPRHYESELNVPTWNYIAVHAYGKVNLVTAQQKVMNLLETTINNYEAAYKTQWDGLPENYKEKLANGIVAFEVEVTEIQGKKKLSQNKNITEQQNIIKELSESSQGVEKDIAKYMTGQISQIINHKS